MSDQGDVLSAALRRRVDLLAELRRLDEFLETYAELSGIPLVEIIKKSPTRSLEFDNNRRIRTMPSETVISDVMGDSSIGMPQREFTDIAKRLLLENGRPMASQQLLERFREAGRRVGGKDELRNLTTKLWRAQDEIVRIPGIGYWPADVQCVEVGYLPRGPSRNYVSGTESVEVNQPSNNLDDDIPF